MDSSSSSKSGGAMEPGFLIHNRFQVVRKIGGGSFGEIFLAHDLHRGCDVAVKCEPRTSKHPQVMYEAKIYRVLAGGKGFPQLHWYGTEGVYNIVVMDLLGPSLEEIFTSFRRRLPLKWVLQIADQMLDRIEYLHKRNFVHRDIKPDNFCFGIPFSGQAKSSSGNGLPSTNPDQVFMLDFGLAKKFRDPRSHQHIPLKTGKSLTGTARYVSISTHLGIEPARRDDLESLCYVWIYFLRGSLPWQGQKAPPHENAAQSKKTKYSKIMSLKMDTSLDELIGQGHMPGTGQLVGGGNSNNPVVPGNAGINYGQVEVVPVKKTEGSSSSYDLAENYWVVTQQHFSQPLPQELKHYLQYCRSLRFEDSPDYGYLRRLLKDVFVREKFTVDRLFDWNNGLPSKFQHGRDRGEGAQPANVVVSAQKIERPVERPDRGNTERVMTNANNESHMPTAHGLTTHTHHGRGAENYLTSLKDHLHKADHSRMRENSKKDHSLYRVRGVGREG